MTELMAILNITPNSFYTGVSGVEQAIAKGVELVREGANLIDIGGEPSWPGAPDVDEQSELDRVIPVIKGLKAQVKVPLSVDTCKPKVAAQAVEAGATILNDITGFGNTEMQDVALSTQADLCVMHMQGTPQTMQLNPSYPEGVVEHLLRWFEKRIDLLLQKGIRKERIIIDPGIGFGKTVDHNLQIIQNLPKLKTMGFRLLLGTSRKSFMGKILNKKAIDLLPATLAINSYLVMGKVDIIRVHDVKEHRDVIDLLSRL